MRVLADKKSNLMKDLVSQAITSKIPKAGELTKGEVIATKSQGIFLDLKNFKTGIILPREIKKDPQRFKEVKPGDELTIKVVKAENEDGHVEVSLLKAEKEKKWEILKEKMEKGETIEASVLKANKGGVMVRIFGIEAFMPVSQLSSEHYPRVEGGDKQKILQELNKLINQKIKLKIIDLDPREEKMIISEKAAEENEIKKTLSKYDVGDIVEGKITGIVDFGIFVKFDNLEGLVHISEVDWQIIDDLGKLFKVGDRIKAKIVEIEGDKISLSIRALKENPWEKVREKYKGGQTVKGTITKFNPFGAFVKLDKDIQGLAHISEFGTEEKMKKALEVGKKYDFKIASIKPSEYRMALKPAFSPSKRAEEKEKKENKKRIKKKKKRRKNKL